MRPTAEFLQQFTSRQESKYIPSHPVVKTVDGKEYTYATDGHRIMILDGALEGVERSDKGPNISTFVSVGPQGIPVNTAILKGFLSCGQPTTEDCQKCDGGTLSCTCAQCDNHHESECGCGGFPVRLKRPVLFNDVGLNSCLLADMVADIEDETVLIHVENETKPIHVFASDRHIMVMPLGYIDKTDKKIPRLEIKNG